MEYHDHLFEFVVDGRPSTLITTGGNVDYDKLCNVPEGTNLKIEEVYIYIDTPLVAGTWGNYHDYDEVDFTKLP